MSPVHEGQYRAIADSTELMSPIGVVLQLEGQVVQVYSGQRPWMVKVSDPLHFCNSSKKKAGGFCLSLTLSGKRVVESEGTSEHIRVGARVSISIPLGRERQGGGGEEGREMES